MGIKHLTVNDLMPELREKALRHLHHQPVVVEAKAGEGMTDAVVQLVQQKVPPKSKAPRKGKSHSIDIQEALSVSDKGSGG